ncbi:MAG: hypothetical protein C5B46_02310, partial [Proteobacteria bacterium]
MAFSRQGMLAGARVTQVIIVINILAYVLQVGANEPLLQAFALWPLPKGYYATGAPSFEFWQLITYGFLHGSPTHLLFNMLALFMFGGDLERVWGGRRFLVYYLACV